MLRIKKIGDMIDKQVYTDGGEFFGKIEEINVADNRIDGWRLVAKSSEMIGMLGGARGIIVPHQFIKAVGDIIIISKNAIPIQQEAEDLPVEEEDMI